MKNTWFQRQHRWALSPREFQSSTNFWSGVLLYSTHTGRAIKTSAVYTEIKGPLNLQKTSLVYFVNMFYRNSSNIPSQISLAKQLLLIHLSNLQLLKFTTTSAIFFNDFKIWYNPLRPRVPHLARVPANACAYFYIFHVLRFKEVIYQKTQNVQRKSQWIPRNDLFLNFHSILNLLFLRKR